VLFRSMKSCGECQACCWLFYLPFLDKPIRTNCPHQCDKGCAIYNQKRHPVCEEFWCEWLHRENWGEELRPDKCGIIFHRRGKTEDGTLVIEASEFNPYSWLRRTNRRAIDRLVGVGHIVMRTYVDTDTTECRAFRDERRHPTVTTRQIASWLKEVTMREVQEQTAV
jgi:hypothetical protein